MDETATATDPNMAKRKRHKDQIQQWKEANRQRVLEYSRQYYQEHGEHYAEMSRAVTTCDVCNRQFQKAFRNKHNRGKLHLKNLAELATNV